MTTDNERHDPDQAHPAAGRPAAPETDGGAAVVIDDVLVEDVSIDGMCGVY